MEAIYLEHGFLYYYGNRAGYQKGDLVYVDPIFYTSFLKESLAKMGRYPKEQEGLYERLLNCQVRSDDGKCRLQFCRIWQWREEVLPEKQEEEDKAMGLADVVIDVLEYYGEAAENDKKERN